MACLFFLITDRDHGSGSRICISDAEVVKLCTAVTVRLGSHCIFKSMILLHISISDLVGYVDLRSYRAILQPPGGARLQ